jgi:hypothetical protein
MLICQYAKILLVVNKVVFPLKKSHDIGKPVKPKGGSFSCKHLGMVKISCTKDDPRLHVLAQLFRSNGIPLEKIYVRRSGSFCEFLISIPLCLCRIVVSLLS